MELSKRSQQRLSIGLGKELLIEIKGMKGKYKAVMIGMDSPRYLIIRLQAASSVYKIIDKDTTLIVRYLFSGSLYGFRVKTLGSIINPFKLIFLSYPEEIETHNLREAERISCFIPATTQFAGQKIHGVITDLSTGGTKFTINTEAMELHKKISLDDTISLSFPLLGMEGNQNCKGQIKRIDGDIDQLSIGVQFQDIDPKVISKIDEYIKSVLDYQNAYEN